MLGPELGAASALKAYFGLQSKALPAIWATLDAAARAYGVADALRGELARTGVDLGAQLDAVERRASGKAWRWVGEMEEAAATFAAVGLPAGFSKAAAATYRQLAATDPAELAHPWGVRGDATQGAVAAPEG